MKFAVLNPGGRDKDQIFPNGAGKPGDPGHPPVNYHAYAACMNGGFFRSETALPPTTEKVLILLRKRNLRKVLETIPVLRKRGIRVFVSCKESGSHQVADLLGDVARWQIFQEICTTAEGAIASTPELVPLYRAAGSLRVEFLPTPYPLNDPAWNFSQPLEKRRGLFVGTREFGVPSRNHLAAVALADEISRDLSCPLAVVNTEGRQGGMILKSFRKKNPLLFIIEAPLPYPDYLRVIALHRIVWQLDSSSVPGQVAGDALLCRMPCLGGNGAIDRIAFLEGTDKGRPELADCARDLLRNDADWEAASQSAQARAREQLSFPVIASRLQEM
ncbi:MAG: hypothetical protein IAE94_12520 [Chthoniobacterales bacterium]|mgnify:CR=1 FL=1|nr:hypothetical protein [Chthoniobacterales bacterium]